MTLPQISKKPFTFANLEVDSLPTPVYITDEVTLEENLKTLEGVHKKTGVNILIALKAYAQYRLFPLIGRYLQGATASSLFEAQLAYEELVQKSGGEVHACAPAYPPSDFAELLHYAEHIVFNSFAQYELFQKQLEAAPRNISIGLRINPEHSEVSKPLYDPCALGSRLGIRLADFDRQRWQSISKKVNGLHFHTLCELGSDALERTWHSVEKKFGDILPQLQWLNMGGGHHITRPDYDIDLLCNLLIKIQEKYPRIRLYLEPGEAIALNSGVLVSTVLDIIPSGIVLPDNKGGEGGPQIKVAVLDASATAHMPDVLEMPYRPDIYTNGSWAGHPNARQDSVPQPHCYRLGGLSCLAGDVVGDYSFAEELSIGQKLFFADMAHYTMVKNTNFNGVRPPAIAIGNTQSGKVELTKYFSYDDYKSRLS